MKTKVLFQSDSSRYLQDVTNNYLVFLMKVCIYLLFLIGSPILEAQQVVNDSDIMSLFYNQMAIFPQEKIYLHTDKPYYLSGERIWFRAHLANAATHVPEPVSRYVYVELYNPIDTMVTRVKIRQEEGA